MRLEGNITSANVSQAAVDALATYLNQTFAPMGQQNGYLGMVGSDSNKATATRYSDPIMQVIWGPPDLETRFELLANSISSNIRSNADNSRVAAGYVVVEQTFINVRWAWIILPVSCIVLGAAFLFLAVRDTKKTGLPLWKDTGIATFYHGLDYFALHRDQDVVLLSSMRAVAEELQVTMGEDLNLGKF